MGWTAPRTYTVGEIITKAILDAHIRDNLRYLKGLDGAITLSDALILPDGAGYYIHIPGLTTVQRDALTPTAGMLIYNTTTTQFNKYENGAWREDLGFNSHHGDLSGLTDDDHTIYQKESLLTTAGDIAYATAASTWDRLGIGTAGQFLKTNAGATAPQWTSAVPSTIVYKAANETVNNSIVLQNDDALVLAVGANERYDIYMYLILSSSAVADFLYDFTIPAASTLTFHVPLLTNAFTAPVVATDAATGTSLSTDGNTQISMVRLLYTGGANAGNVQFRWAQNVAEVSNTIVYAGSYIIADKIV